QANFDPPSKLELLLRLLNSLSEVFVLVSGFLIFGGACYLVVTRKRAAVLAAYLVLLPVPVSISLSGWIYGASLSLWAIGTMPDVTVTTEQVAEATAKSLTELFVAIVVTAPTYLVLAAGLLWRTLRPLTDSAGPVSSHVVRRDLLPNPGGAIP